MAPCESVRGFCPGLPSAVKCHLDLLVATMSYRFRWHIPDNYRRILIFSVYFGIVGAGWTWLVGQPLFGLEYVVLVFVGAAISAGVAGMIAAYEERPPDGLYAGFLTWLLFAGWSAAAAVLVSIVSAVQLLEISGGSAIVSFFNGVFTSIFVCVLALWFASGPALVATLLFQLPKLAVRFWPHVRSMIDR